MNHDLQTWTEQLRSGDVRALARAISTVENRAAGSSDLLKAAFAHSGRAQVIGLTGPPGAGKSTLVDQLARHCRNTEKPETSHFSRTERARNRAPGSSTELLSHRTEGRREP